MEQVAQIPNPNDMSKEESQSNVRHKAGRKPKSHPAIFRYSIYLDEVENALFLGCFDQSGMNSKANFITSCIFDKPLKVLKLDKVVIDYYMRLTTFYSQYRAIGVNYNQVLAVIKSSFSDRKALVYLAKLERATFELVISNHQIMTLAQELEVKIYGSKLMESSERRNRKNN